jgi:hypothetical protein
MILFKPDGTEITRLPGEVDPERYLLTLTTGLNAQVPVKDLVQRGLSGQPLSPEQWRLLAFYSWDTDEQQVLSTAELPQRLSDLAARVPSDLPAVRDRLSFKSLVERAQAGSAGKPVDVEAGRQLVGRILSNPDASRQIADMLMQYAEPVVKYLAPIGDFRHELATRWEVSLTRLLNGPALTRADQVTVIDARVGLWKLMTDDGSLSADQRARVLSEIARLVASTTDRYERQAVVPDAAHVLTEAGLIAQSDELLKFELTRAVAPYYHMLVLGSNAAKRQDAKSALSWYEQAWRKSEGPATRLQWGTGYVGRVIELSPNDVTRVQTAAKAVIGQLDAKSETFYERNQRSLQKMATGLIKWQGSDKGRARAVDQARQLLAKTCTRLPQGEPGRANCEGVFSNTGS